MQSPDGYHQGCASPCRGRDIGTSEHLGRDVGIGDGIESACQRRKECSQDTAFGIAQRQYARRQRKNSRIIQFSDCDGQTSVVRANQRIRDLDVQALPAPECQQKCRRSCKCAIVPGRDHDIRAKSPKLPHQRGYSHDLSEDARGRLALQQIVDVDLGYIDRFQSLLSDTATHGHDQVDVRLLGQAIGQMQGNPARASMTKGKLG